MMEGDDSPTAVFQLLRREVGKCLVRMVRMNGKQYIEIDLPHYKVRRGPYPLMADAKAQFQKAIRECEVAIA